MKHIKIIFASMLAIIMLMACSDADTANDKNILEDFGATPQISSNLRPITVNSMDEASTDALLVGDTIQWVLRYFSEADDVDQLGYHIIGGVDTLSSSTFHVADLSTVGYSESGRLDTVLLQYIVAPELSGLTDIKVLTFVANPMFETNVEVVQIGAVN